jgi:hypothetical protein
VSGARAAAVASACLLLGVAQAALADVRLRTDVTPRQVEIGAQFSVRLSITSDGRDSISEPELKVPSGVRIFGTSVQQGSSVSIIWMLMASRAGKFKLGPASVTTSKGRQSDKPVTIEVVPQGTLPRGSTPPLGGQPSPLGILRGFGGGNFPGFPGFPGFDEPEAQPELPPLPDGYAIDRAQDPVAFLRATAEPRQVVVGEQVTLSVYAYGGRGDFGAAFLTEGTRDDFLSVSIDEDGDAVKRPFELDGKRWIVSKLTSHALFPLKAGSLKIGSTSIGFSGPGYSNSPQGLLRKSAPLTIEVVEPPLKGRPPGYHLGDVGEYTLKAQVEPREVPINGSISVIAKLEGTGNLPFTLLVPEQNGVHFLEPQLVEQIAPRRGKVQGFRTFTYVVELTRPGDIELGEITLPYYDANARAYGIARASLGKVKVTGNAPAPAASRAQGDNGTGPSLAKLVEPARKLGPNARKQASYWPSRLGYWLLLFALPLSAVVGFALADVTRLLRRRASERRGSLAAALDEALGRLRSATQSGDVAASAGAAERVLFLAIERATGLKARGVLKAELASTLERHQVPTPLAEQATRLLARCDELRFAGEALDLPSFGAEVREISQKLGQRKTAAKPGGEP